jgi:hypothetical protein
MATLAVASFALVALVAAEPANASRSPKSSRGSAARDSSLEGDWWTLTERELRQREYEMSWQERTVLDDLEAAWQAPNRAHDFRAYFTEGGVRLVPRREARPSWEWSLALVGYGRGTAVAPVEAGRLSASGHRLAIDRGLIEEWYLNGPRGLEQGFDLQGPPSLPEGERPVTMAGVRREPLDAEGVQPAYPLLTLGGELAAHPTPDGQAIDFRDRRGSAVLRLWKLEVLDASGRALPAWMEVFREAGVRGLRIVFDDRNATYPVVVDPLATSPAWTAEGGQEAAELGLAVATAGDVNGDGYSDVVLGAYSYDDGITKADAEGPGSTTVRPRVSPPPPTGSSRGASRGTTSATPWPRPGT